jgi:hypothetical protein
MHADLMEAYIKVSGRCWTQMEAYEKMVKQPAPRYYVTAKQAYQVLLHMMKGDFEIVDSMPIRKKKMYYSLFEQVIKLSEKRSFIGKSLWYIVPFAINCPAPEFFISAERARHIRGWLRSGAIKEDGRIDDTIVKSYVNTRVNKRTKSNRIRKKDLWMSEKM